MEKTTVTIDGRPIPLVVHADGDGRVKTLVKDPRIVWPNSFALGPDGAVWFTTSQIHLGPNPKTPYRVLNISPQ